MKLAIAAVISLIATVFPAPGQEPKGRGASRQEPAKFEIADLHANPGSPNSTPYTLPLRDGRYIVKNATLANLMQIAYDATDDQIQSGPDWLRADRFDVRAKLPEGAPAGAYRQMLQSLLADRFQLVAHKESRPMPAYELSVGKKLKLKPADGKGGSGCTQGKYVRQRNSRNDSMRAEVVCRNVTMAQFAEKFRDYLPGGRGFATQERIYDRTELTGSWTFNLSIPLVSGSTMGLSAYRPALQAVGLQLEEKDVPRPVMVVDSVNRIPSPNPPEVETLLPVIPPPTKFASVSLKAAFPQNHAGFRTVGDEVLGEGVTLQMLIVRAFNLKPGDRLANLPDWANVDRYDLSARIPDTPELVPDAATIAPMLRAFMEDRFHMKYHMEERSVDGYALVADQPMLQAGDAGGPSSCQAASGPESQFRGLWRVVCQNVTMAHFAQQLQRMVPELNGPVADETKLTGAWNFTFAIRRALPGVVPGEPMPGLPPGMTGADGEEPSFIEALDRQLGLKLVPAKRNVPVAVLDHIEHPSLNR